MELFSRINDGIGPFLKTLNPIEKAVIKLLAVNGCSLKEVALRIDRTYKATEHIVSHITSKYRKFYPEEKQASLRRILNRAARYYGEIEDD